VRGLTPADVEAADVVLKAAYGGSESRAETLRRFLTLDAGGWRVAVDGNTILGCVGALDYGRFAYVGMMAVRPDAQGRGIGRALMQDVLTWIGDRGTASVLLDATAAGAPLYTALGFEDEDDVCRYTRADDARPTARPDSAITLGPDDVQRIGRLEPFSESPSVIASGANGAAREVLARYGFAQSGGTRHMRRGPGVPRERASIWGQVNYAAG
jgi:GNAT superfamily N-acetyltransferase